MLFFDHEQRAAKKPETLTDNDARATLEIAKYFTAESRERSQTDLPAVWKLPLTLAARDALQQLAFGKCPFCERVISDLKPYRFRPPGYARPGIGQDDKACYLWLALSWENLFPICDECLPVEKSYFPVEKQRARFSRRTVDGNPVFPGVPGSEKAILLYPGETKVPTQAFDVLTNGRLVGKNERANATIQHFRLNRAELVSERRRAFQRHVLDNQLAFRSLGYGGAEIFEQLSLGGAIYLFLRRIGQRLWKKLGSRPLSLNEILASFEQWSRKPAFGNAIQDAVQHLSDIDQSVPTSEAMLDHEPSRKSPRLDLQRVSIRNFKSLESIDFEFPIARPPAGESAAIGPDGITLADAACLLILGENATGKSSILEAVTLAAISGFARDSLKLRGQDLTLDPEYMGATADPMAEPRNSRIELRFRDGDTISLEIRGQDGQMLAGHRQDGRSPLMFAYGAHRLFSRARRSENIRHIDTLFGNDRQLSNPVGWLRTLTPAALDEVASALRHIIQIDGRFESIGIRTDASGESECVINLKKQRADGSEFIVPMRLDVASSGYRAVMALVCDVLEGLMDAHKGLPPHEARKAPAVVVVDEIEAHLHPRWKLQIITGLRQALPMVTFIFTSHDPLCVRGMHDGEVMMLNRYYTEKQVRRDIALDGDTSPSDGQPFQSEMPECVESITRFEALETLTIEQLLTSDMFQLFSTDSRRTDLRFAEAADLLAKAAREDRLTDAEANILNELREEIAKGLPYGRSEVTRLVQEAVAEYLASRRTESQARSRELRDKAKAAVTSYLSGLVR